MFPLNVLTFSLVLVMCLSGSLLLPQSPSLSSSSFSLNESSIQQFNSTNNKKLFSSLTNKTRIGDKCDSADECGQNAMCISKRSTCAFGYTKSNFTDKFFSEYYDCVEFVCSRDIQCFQLFGSYTECSDDKCQCEITSNILYRKQKCYPETDPYWTPTFCFWDFIKIILYIFIGLIFLIMMFITCRRLCQKNRPVVRRCNPNRVAVRRATSSSRPAHHQHSAVIQARIIEASAPPPSYDMVVANNSIYKPPVYSICVPSVNNSNIDSGQNNQVYPTLSDNSRIKY